MKLKINVVLIGLGFACLPAQSHAALVLSGTSYSESFDGIGAGLPSGWTVRTGATASFEGTAGIFLPSAAGWANTAGAFKNFASSEGLASLDTLAAQTASTDRALGIRQTETFGDPGAAFVLQIQNTVGLGDFALSLKAQMLSDQSRSTVWTMDYRIGNSGNFIALGTYVDPKAFGSTKFNFNSSQLAAWNNQATDIWFRFVALNGSTGSSTRDSIAIDDFSLSFSAVPEPGTWGAISAAGLLAMFGLQTWRLRRGAAR